MRKLLVLTAVLCTALVAASPAAASKPNVTCTGIMTGIHARNVTVPSSAACTLVDSTVRDNVWVGTDSYFQATNTDVGDSVRGKKSQTVFIEAGSSVGDDVNTDRTGQVFVFGSFIGGEIDVYKTAQAVNVCGSRVRGDIEVTRSGRDILVGDPAAVDCAGNRVLRGDIEVKDNSTDVELTVSGNTVLHGNLEVNRNKGTSDKKVTGNVGGETLECRDNDNPFVGTPNIAWDNTRGSQCTSS